MAKNSAINKDVDNLVEKDAIQTLTNKTLTTPSIGDFTNSTHNHSNNAGGGQITDAALSAAVGIAKGGTGLTATPTDGELLIGKTDGTYAQATLTEGANITITNGNGTITIAASSGEGFTWNVATEDATAAVNNGYVSNAATRLTFTLPGTAAVGSSIRVAGLNTGGWKIAQPASVQIHFGSVSTSSGTGGYLESTHARDVVELLCVVANTTWVVLSSVGNITYA